MVTLGGSSRNTLNLVSDLGGCVLDRTNIYGWEDVKRYQLCWEVERVTNSAEDLCLGLSHQRPLRYPVQEATVLGVEGRRIVNEFPGCRSQYLRNI